MPKIKQTQDDGTEIEIEVVPAEEFEEKLSEKDKQLDELSRQKQELEDQLNNMVPNDKKDDHPNFKALKEALSKKDLEINELRKQFDDDKKSRIDDFVNTNLSKLSKGDAELEKKIRLHMDTTLSGMSVANQEDLSKKILAAYKLSQDAAPAPDMFDGGMNSGGGNYFPVSGGNDSSNDFTPKEKALGMKFGITEEDYKKYASRVSKRIN